MEKQINRRDFLKIAGTGTLAAAAISCAGKKAVKTVASSAKTLGEMTYRTSPEGNKISILGYGCMRWPMITDENSKRVIDQETVDKLVDYAIEHGVNYFDTAPTYLQGQSEPATGKSLKRYPRESIYIATKLSNFRIPKTFEASLEMYRNSFKNLQTDYIDYYLLHSISDYADYRSRFVDNKMIDFLLKERQAGRIRHLGYSIHSDRKAFDEVLADHEKYHWDFVQIQMNYIDWIQDAEYFYTELEKRGIPVIIMEPLLGGQLAKIPEHFASQLRERKPAESVASWAFRFCGSKPGILTVLSGMTYMEHLQDNLKTYCPLEELSEDDLNLLDEVAHEFVQFPLIPCTGCQYCMPCPYGVDIPGVFAHYNKCLNEGSIKDDKGDPAYREARRKFLVSLDRNVETLRQSEHCIHCGKCLRKCPQRIGIPDQMQRISEYTEQLRRDKKF